MDYERISRIEKSKRYAEERELRIDFQNFTATIRGDNSIHTVNFSDKTWTCSCDFFQKRGYCAHTMALERVLDTMIPSRGETEYSTDPAGATG
ncbi:MAG: SWIM zinc finger family protein [Anaerolineae bacterium]|nr:SWIM zinc finger family protein [Anaerolineae bacterium]